MNNKALITNLLAALIIGISFISPQYQAQLFTVGAFALSGAVTNWLAVHMLFEKVPFLYGSGVIPNQFETFRISIKSLIMQQFFTAENVNRFLLDEESSMSDVIDIQPVLNAIDYDQIFQSLLDVITNSSLGGMLAMVGGTKVLDSLREPFKEKISHEIENMVHSENFQRTLKNSMNNQQLTDDILNKISTVIDSRLEELTPQMVKEIVQAMIHQHLGWLVVWGGLFGGLIGLVVSFFPH